MIIFNKNILMFTFLGLHLQRVQIFLSLNLQKDIIWEILLLGTSLLVNTITTEKRT